MATSRHRDLVAYRVAAELADDVCREVIAWEKFHQWTVGVQLVRALDSIGANIAEALGRHSEADRKRLLIVARGSLLEAEHWVDRAASRALMEKRGVEPRLTRLARLLNGLLQSQRLHD